MRKINITKDFIIEHYFNNHKTQEEVAELIGCHRDTVCKAMLEHDLKMRNRSERGGNRLGSKHSHETITKMSGKNNHRFGKRGTECYQWRGGVSHPRNTADYKEWRARVYKKNNYTCKFCKDTKTKLNAHHIKYFGDYPDSRYDVGNGITLCKPCHEALHWDRIKLDKRAYA